MKYMQSMPLYRLLWRKPSVVLVTPSDKTIRATKATDSIVLQSMMVFLFLHSVQVEYTLKTELYFYGAPITAATVLMNNNNS